MKGQFPAVFTITPTKATQETQAERFKDMTEVYCNAQMPGRMVREVCCLDSAGLTLLKTAMERLQISAHRRRSRR